MPEADARRFIVQLPDTERPRGQFAPAQAIIDDSTQDHYAYRGIVVQGNKVTHYVKNNSGKHRLLYSRRSYFTEGEEHFSADPIGKPALLSDFISAALVMPEDAAQHAQAEREAVANDLRDALIRNMEAAQEPKSLKERGDQSAIADALVSAAMTEYPLPGDTSQRIYAEQWLDAIKKRKPGLIKSITEGRHISLLTTHTAFENALNHAIQAMTQRTEVWMESQPRNPTEKQSLQLLAAEISPAVHREVRAYYKGISNRINPASGREL